MTRAKARDDTDIGLRILRMKEVQVRIGLSQSRIFDMIVKGHFPKPFLIVPGGRAVGWLESEIDTWIQRRVLDTAEYHEGEAE